MKKQTCLAFFVAASLLASAALTIQAQTWEAYPQGAFYPWAIAVHPLGTTAYAGNDVLIRRGDAGGTIWSDASLPVVPAGHRWIPKGDGNGLAVGPSGSVYLAGGFRNLSDGSRTSHLFESSDGGTSWRSIFNEALPWGTWEVATDAAGNIYLETGYLPGNPGSWASTLHCYRIRKGVTDPVTGNVTWTILDDYPGSGQLSHSANSITIRPMQNPALAAEIWVAGRGINAKTFKDSFPFVRRSLDGGVTWATVNAWPVPRGYTFAAGSSPVAGADANGAAYVSARYEKKVGRTVQNDLLTYRSVNQGATWTLVDVLAGISWGPTTFASDALGRVFIVGSGFVRASADGGNTWVSPNLPGAYNVASDLAGNVFVGGDGVIYKLPAP